MSRIRYEWFPREIRIGWRIERLSVSNEVVSTVLGVNGHEICDLWLLFPNLAMFGCAGHG